MIGVVLDTNIVVSALLIPQGPPARVFLMALQNQDTQLCVSAEVFAEYEEVLNRPNLISRQAQSQKRLAAFVRRDFGSNRQGR